jgi:hypothetical protein
VGAFFAGILTWLIGKLFGAPAGQPLPVQEGEKLGAATAAANTDAATVKTVEGENQAAANSPTTQAGVVGELQSGKF